MARLVEVAEGVRIYGTSSFDTQFLYQEIFDWGSYRDLPLPDRPFIVDAGSNIGVFTLYMKRQWPDAEILAFEPVGELTEAMRDNIALFELSDVSVHQAALGARTEGNVPCRYYPLRPSGSSLVLDDQAELRRSSATWMSPRLSERMYRSVDIEVPVARLSDFLPDDRAIDLVKIDVVGSERAVLDGIDEHHWPLVRRAIIDVQDVDNRLSDLEDLLRARGMDTELRRNERAGADDVNLIVYAHRAIA